MYLYLPSDVYIRSIEIRITIDDASLSIVHINKHGAQHKIKINLICIPWNKEIYNGEMQNISAFWGLAIDCVFTDAIIRLIEHWTRKNKNFLVCLSIIWRYHTYVELSLRCHLCYLPYLLSSVGSKSVNFMSRPRHLVCSPSGVVWKWSFLQYTNFTRIWHTG